MDLARDDRDIEVSPDSLAAAAAAQGFDIIDIRTAEEVAQRPAALIADAAVRHIPMQDLLADPALLSAGRPALLVCASGKRSLATARALREQGLPVRSLAGGLQNLERLSAIHQ